ncbi:hypothetical protein KAR91_04960 [Candidatus Pacearchaeota archaeon]|nr:hypothetical protein [Candidatus Pacearchaeota archaeon]
MLKNKIWFGIILSIILLAFSANAFTAYYKYTQESGTLFYVASPDKSDALEDTNEVRQIIDDLGNLLVHSKRNDLYPKDETTGGTLAIPNSALVSFATGTKGDIWYCSAENTWIKLNIGTDNQIFVVATDLPNWETPSSDLLSDVASIAMLDENEDITGTWTVSTGSIEGVDATEFGYLNGVTSDIQTQFGLRYLKTEMDEFSELQAIVSDKTITKAEDWDTHAELAAILNIGIIDDYLLEVDGSPNSGEYSRFTVNGLEGRTEAEFKGDFNLEIGTDVQAYDATLLSIAALGTAANKIAYTTDVDTWAETALTAFGRSILDDADEATFKATVNLEIGTDVLAEQTVGIADDNLVEMDDADAADDDIAIFTPAGLEGSSYAETKALLDIETNTVLCSNYDHPDDAITAIGGNDKTLLVTESETCDANFEVPENVKVLFERDGFWTIENGITVTFNGQLEAGLWQIFSYTGTGTLAGTPVIDTVYPQWWATGTGANGTEWANNCIEEAYTFTPAGATIFLPQGYYTLDGTLTIAKTINIIGAGIGKTIIETAGGAVDGIYSTGVDYITLKDFTIDGDAQDDNSIGHGCITFNSDCDNLYIVNVEVKNGGYYGIDNFECNYGIFKNIYTHDNFYVGFHPGSNTTAKNIYNTYEDIYAWNNGNVGFGCRGIDVDPREITNNSYKNIKAWDNTSSGITIGDQHGVNISHLFAYSNDGTNGVYLWELEDSNITNVVATYNAEVGIIVIDSKNLNITNSVSKNNNVSDAAKPGMIVEDSSFIKYISCASFDDRDPMLQTRGIHLQGACTDISFIFCKLLPNLTTNLWQDGDTYAIIEASGNSVRIGDGIPTDYIDITNVGAVTLVGTANIEGVDATEFGHLDGITEDIQTAINTILANVSEDATPEYGGPMDHNSERDTEVLTIEFVGLIDAGNSGAAIDIDWQEGNYQEVTISENTTISFINEFVGTITLMMTYDGGNYTVALGDTILEEGGVELVFTETDGAVDILKVMNLGVADTFVVGVLLDVKD